MASTIYTHFLDDTTKVSARDVPGYPGDLVAKIFTGLAEITLHGNHAQLTRLAAALTEQLAQLAPEVPADTEAAGVWDPITPDPNYLCSEYGGDPICQVIPTWRHQTAVGRFSCDGHMTKTEATR